MRPSEVIKRQSRLRLLSATAVVVAIIVAWALYAQGRGQTAFVIPWFLPATGSILFILGCCVAYLAFGRYEATSDAASFWIGFGCFGFGIGMAFNMLAFPGLLGEGRQIIGKLSNTAVWEGTVALGWLATGLFLAPLLHWPGKWRGRRSGWRWTLAALLAAVVALHLLFVLFEDYLPTLITARGSFTPLFVAINGPALGILSILGAVISTRQSSREAHATTGSMTGYIAACQLTLLAVAILTMLEIRRWDVFWYIQRFLWVGGFLVMFFGLLSEYVKLFRLEQTKSAELAATTVELKKSEEQLRRSETTLRTAIEATGLGTFDFNPRTGELIWSDQAKLHFGLPPSAETNYKVFQSALHPDDRERVKGLLQQALQPGSRGVYRAEYRTIGLQDGRERWLIARGQVFYDETGEAARVVGATLDMTDRKRAEGRLRRIFDSGMIGIFYWNMAGVILDANDKFLQIIGRGRDELESGGMKWIELTPEERHELDRQAMEEVKRNGLGTPYEKEFLRPDGTRVPVIIGAATLDETRSEGVSFVLDISDRKQVEEELRKARDYLEVRVQERTAELTRALQELKSETEERIHAVDELRVREHLLMQQSRLAAMGEMLVNISHQWRQPLNVVGLLLQKLVMSYDGGNFSRELLEKNVNRGTELIEHLSRTIDDFTTYLSPDRMKVPFEVGEVVDKAVSMMGETLRDIDVEVQGKEAPVSIIGHRNEYLQVLFNILINARDAFRERGIMKPRISIRIFSEEEKRVLTITDNAGGIPDEVIDKIFDPYFTTKAPGKGTGIGLFMSKTIIEKSMGGRLTVRNTDDGAEFRIEV